MEDFDDSGPLTLEDVIKNPKVRREVRRLLEVSEQILTEEGLFVDSLGGAALSASLKYLLAPNEELILSNLAMEDGHVVLTDFGLMDVKDTEPVYAIPHSEWAMRIVLSFLGYLTFEAMNIILRDFGEDMEPRPLTAANALPKIVAGVGCRVVTGVKKVYESMNWTWLATLGESCRSIS